MVYYTKEILINMITKYPNDYNIRKTFFYFKNVESN